MTVRAKRLGILAMGLVVTIAMLILGLWQMSVFQGQGRLSAEQYAALPPVPLSEHLKGTDSTAAWGRQVTVTGSYLPKLEFTWGEAYPLKVVTGFRTTDGKTIAIVRGLLPFQGTITPAPTGTLTQTGVILPGDEKSRSDLPSKDLPTGNVQALRLPALAQKWPAPLINGYISLGAGDAATQKMQPSPPKLTGGQGRSRNAGYALQWWVFAAAAMGFSIVLARSVKADPAKG